MPLEWAELQSRSEATLEDLVGPFLLRGVGGSEQANLHAGACQRYLAYLGTLNETDAVQSLKSLLYELSITTAWLAGQADPEMPAVTLAAVRSVLTSNLTPLQVAQITEAFRAMKPPAS
ncbi:hypothetical protein OG523_01195 [Streptomyces virginiae]|uniref:hypothetical protein n=1 Tax=Streptomyces virginiae TaxID=1961 RepID=UPI002E32997C|nr:hypothetical protein [Streptomyces virginiae]